MSSILGRVAHAVETDELSQAMLVAVLQEKKPVLPRNGMVKLAGFFILFWLYSVFLQDHFERINTMEKRFLNVVTKKLRSHVNRKKSQTNSFSVHFEFRFV